MESLVKALFSQPISLSTLDPLSTFDQDKLILADAILDFVLPVEREMYSKYFREYQCVMVNNPNLRIICYDLLVKYGIRETRVFLQSKFREYRKQQKRDRYLRYAVNSCKLVAINMFLFAQ